MDAMNLAVYASAMLRQLNGCTCSRGRPAERCEPCRSSGDGPLARIATAIGAFAASAVFLVLAAR